MTSARFMSGSRQLLEDLPGLEAEGPDHRKGRVKGTGPAQLDHAAWDERRRELNVVYEANLNGERKRACEIMQFHTSGRQIGGQSYMRGDCLNGSEVPHLSYLVERRAMRQRHPPTRDQQSSAFGVGYLRVSFPGMSLRGISPSGISGHRLYMAGRPTSAPRSNCIVTRKSVPSIFSSCQISRLREPPQLR